MLFRPATHLPSIVLKIYNMLFRNVITNYKLTRRHIAEHHNLSLFILFFFMARHSRVCQDLLIV